MVTLPFARHIRTHILNFFKLYIYVCQSSWGPWLPRCSNQYVFFGDTLDTGDTTCYICRYSWTLVVTYRSKNKEPVFNQRNILMSSKSKTSTVLLEDNVLQSDAKTLYWVMLSLSYSTAFYHVLRINALSLGLDRDLSTIFTQICSTLLSHSSHFGRKGHYEYCHDVHCFFS